MASDSRFLCAVGFEGVLEVTDEGGWSREVLPLEDVPFAADDGAGATPEAWAEAAEACPGCDKGNLVPLETIVEQASKIRI